MSEDTNAVDMAVILEGRIKERVSELLLPMVERVVVNIIGKELVRQWDENKQKMQMEIAIQLGKILKQAEDDNRKPLWDSKPEEFGLTANDLNSHMMGKEIDDAIQKQI
jgi:hypothetical protein